MVIGQNFNMGRYGKRQMSPSENGQAVQPQEPTSLTRLEAANTSGTNEKATDNEKQLTVIKLLYHDFPMDIKVPSPQQLFFT